MNRPLTQEEFGQAFHEQWQKVRDEIALLDSLMVRAEVLYGTGSKPQPFYGHSVMEDIMEMVKERDENRPD